MITKDTRVKRELRRLREIFGGGSMDVCEHLIQNAAYVAVTLEDLRKAIDEHGLIDETIGSTGQPIRKASAEAEQYTKFAKTYTTIIKQLADFVPEKKEEADELLEFIRR